MKRKIIVVEDDLDLIYVMGKVLELLRYDPILATNGKQAVDMITAQLPDLILLDIMLPEIDGLNVARLTRQNPKTHSVPILAVTAKTSFSDKEECLKSGCDDYIAKPFTFKQLIFRIEKLLI